MTKNNDHNQYSFITAIRNDNIKAVQCLLNAININFTYENGITALIEASSKGYLSIVNLLLSIQNIDINQTDLLGETALMKAVNFNHKAIVKLLLKHKDIDIHQENIFHYSAVHMAYLSNKHEIAKLLYTYQSILKNPKVKADLIELMEFINNEVDIEEDKIEKILEHYVLNKLFNNDIPISRGYVTIQNNDNDLVGKNDFPLISEEL